MFFYIVIYGNKKRVLGFLIKIKMNFVEILEILKIASSSLPRRKQRTKEKFLMQHLLTCSFFQLYFFTI